MTESYGSLLLILSILITLSPLANAQKADESIIITQVVQSKHLLIADGFKEEASVHEHLLVTWEGKQCELDILEMGKDGAIVLDTSSCPFEKHIKTGDQLEISSIESIESNSKKDKIPKPEKNNTPQTKENTSVSHDIGDLMYIPPKETLGIGFGYKNSDSNHTLTFDSIEYYTSEVGKSETVITASYGLTSRMAIGIQQPITLKKESTTSFGDASNRTGETDQTSSDGLQDPEILLKYRLKTQPSFGNRVDIGLTASPSVQDAKYATTEKNGTAGRGADSYTIQVDVGKKVNVHDFKISGALGYTGQRKSKSAEDSSSVTSTKSRTNFGLSGNYRFIVNSSFDLRGGLRLLSADKVQSQLASGTKIEEDRHLETTVSFGAAFYPIPNVLMLQFEYFSTASEDFGAKIGSTNLEIEGLQQSGINISLTGEF